MLIPTVFAITFSLLQLQLIRVSGSYNNPIETHALQQLFLATDGAHWQWNTDPQAGEKWRFDDLEHFNPCTHLWQGAYCAGADPACTADNPLGCHIFCLSLNAFNLSGTVPAEAIRQLSQLSQLSLGENHLVGRLPSLSTLMSISYVNFSHNHFSGSIPSDFLPTDQSIDLVYLSSNNLTGSIPDTFYDMANLVYLNLYNNMLNGTISEKIESFSNSLRYMNFGKNRFSGTLPSNLNKLQSIQYLYLYGNNFVGELSGLVVGLSSLRELWISDNELTGPLPSQICNNRNITMLAVHHNNLTGTLPPCLSGLAHLQILQVQQNEFKGKNLESVFNPTVQTHLEVVDLSDNAFSGSLPSNIFYLPSLQSIAAVKNCFEGRIPEAICESSRFLSVIALDGMRLSPKCLNYIWDPLQLSVGYFSTLMEGTIPDCIWSLPNISVVHLSGNGFDGTLPNVIPENPRYGYTAGKCTLRDLSLSHNKLFGTIPKEIQAIPFNHLDLSFNKLFGGVDKIVNMPLSYNSNTSGADINLEENRLSGSLPMQWSTAFDIDVLNGNLFACMGRKDLPEHDPHFDTYICGSSEFDDAMHGFGVIVAIIVALTIFAISIAKLCLPSNELYFYVSKLIQAVRYTFDYSSHIYDFDRYLFRKRKEEELADSTFDSARPSDLSFNSANSMYDEAEKERMIRYRNAFQFISALSLIRSVCIFVALYALVICLPVYLIFYTAGSSDSTQYSSHSQRYGWLSTSVFITGQLPASVLLFLWSSLIIMLMVKFIVHFNLHTLESSKLVKWLSSLTTSDKSAKLRESSWSLRSSGQSAVYSPISTQASSLPPNFPESAKDDDLVSVRLTEDDLGLREGSQRQSMFPISIDQMKQLVADRELKDKLKSWFLYTFIFVTNTVVCICVNIAYLFIQNASDISSDVKGFMQILMAGFKIFWNLVAIRIMISWLPYEKGSVKLHVFMLVFNSIIAPCLATAFTDESCFRDFFKGSNTICTSYHIHTCLESYQMMDFNTQTYKTVCTNLADISYVTEIQPTFIYYYTCGSKLLTNYVPVYVYIYTILLFSGPFLYAILASWRTSSFPIALLKKVDGILRPADRGKCVFERLIRGVSIQALLTQHIVVLLTFGICSPLLALVMTVAISVDCFLWQLVITRYIKYENETIPFSPKYIVTDNEWDHVTRCWQGWVCCCFQSAPSRASSAEKKKFQQSVKNDSDAKALSPLLPTSRGQELQSIDAEGSFRQSAFLRERHLQILNFHRNERTNQIKEDARLQELHTIIGDAWMCVRNAMWLVFYCSMLFYGFVLFDMVGDKGGWQGGLYLVAIILLLIFIIRLFLVDATIYLHNWSSTAEYSSHHYQFSAFYYHKPIPDHGRNSSISFRNSDISNANDRDEIRTVTILPESNRDKSGDSKL